MYIQSQGCSVLWAFHFSTGGFLSHLFVGGQRLTSISTRELHCTCGLARRLMEGLNSRFPSNLFRMRREVQPAVKLHRALKVTWSFPQVQPLGLEKPTLRDLLCRHFLAGHLQLCASSTQERRLHQDQQVHGCPLPAGGEARQMVTELNTLATKPT